MQYILGIDQSTQGTKAMLFDGRGDLLLRTDKCHAQLIDEKGWVEHDPEEIYQNTLKAVKDLLEQSSIDRASCHPLYFLSRSAPDITGV